MRRLVSFALVLVIAFSLCACGHQHEWVEASCEEPKTCATCGKTEGEPLGHEWTEASCAKPKTCARCGAEEGEPLEHTVVDATYQRGSYCSVCGEELSEPVPGDYEKMGLEKIVKNLEDINGEEFIYLTCMAKGGIFKPEEVAFGTAVSTWAICENADNWYHTGDESAKLQSLNCYQEIEQLAPAEEEYEWRAIYTASSFYVDYGTGTKPVMPVALTDYYEAKAVADAQNTPVNGFSQYIVSFEGRELPVYYTFESWTDDIDYGGVADQIVAVFYVPKGYDGCAVLLLDGSILPPSPKDRSSMDPFNYINDNSILLRLK